MVNSKQKGKRVELELVHWLEDHGIRARRTQQFNGAEGLSDIISADLPECHIECKGVKDATLNRSKLLEWLEQVIRDCPADQPAPVLLCKSNGKAVVAALPLSVWEYIKPADESCYFAACVEPSINPTYELKKVKDTVRLLFFAERMRCVTLAGVYYGADLDKGLVWVFLDGEDWLHVIRKWKAVKED